MSNIIARHPEFPATDTITDAGAEAAYAHLRDINPDLSAFEAGMVIDVIARDWAHGEEERVMKTLSHYVDLTGAYRVVAALVAESSAHRDADTETEERTR
jgi:hypothetical protein